MPDTIDREKELPLIKAIIKEFNKDHNVFMLIIREDLERIKKLVQLLNSYVDHHANNYEGNNFYQELENLIENLLKNQRGV